MHHYQWHLSVGEYKGNIQQQQLVEAQFGHFIVDEFILRCFVLRVKTHTVVKQLSWEGIHWIRKCLTDQNTGVGCLLVLHVSSLSHTLQLVLGTNPFGPNSCHRILCLHIFLVENLLCVNKSQDVPYELVIKSGCRTIINWMYVRKTVQGSFMEWRVKLQSKQPSVWSQSEPAVGLKEVWRLLP